MNQDNRQRMGVIIWPAISCALHFVLFRSKLDTEMQMNSRLLFALLAIIITLPLHEVIHCVFMKLFGMKNARIEFARDPSGMPSLRAIAQGGIHGIKRAVMYAAPFLLLTVVPDIFFLLSDRVHFVFFIAAMCNSAGCYFDMVEALRSIKTGSRK